MSSLSRTFTACAVALVVGVSQLPAQAQNFYNGDWNGSIDVRSSERDLFVADSRIYDDFFVSQGIYVQSIFGNFLSDLTPTQAYWEIRQGVSAGNGGTLLYSGLSDITWLATGNGGWGYNEYEARVSGLDLHLAPADVYWLTIAPVSSDPGRGFINSTGGVNGVNALLDGNSFWASQTFGQNFTPITGPDGNGVDFSYGVDAILNPEPGAIILLGTGLAGVLLAGRVVRRKKVLQD